MIEREEVLKEVIEYNKRPQLREDEILVRHYMKAWDTDPKRSGPATPSKARKDLEGMVRDGVMTRRKVFHEGHWVNAYRRKEE